MDVIAKKHTGSFYTCNYIADYIAKWAIDTPELCVLEPSFGDGIFIDSAISQFASLGNLKPKIIGVEIQKEPYNLYMEHHATVSGFQMDFMEYRSDTKINVVIGNPPYIRLKKLKNEEREKALQVVSSYDIEIQTSSSLWVPFVIHSTELLQPNGKLGFVLPYEITHVRYAFDLWNYLSKKYGKITICRIYRDIFPDVDVETIIFLAEEKGKTTDFIYYNVFETIEDLHNNNTIQTSKILIKDIIDLKKPFEHEQTPKEVINILEGLRQNNKLTSLVQDCKFKIGYVSGNKDFFHVSKDNIQQFKINKKNIRKSLINAKQITANIGIGIETKAIEHYSFLFYPIRISNGEKRYIKYGETQGINKGYKCRGRKPWYVTPCLEMPDVILTVFGDVPKLLLNNGSFYVSNSLLSGVSRVNCKEIICRWYNSLTLLSVELKIHSLGGGTLVLIPGETDKLEIVSDFPKEKVESTYTKLADFAKNNKTEDIYTFGDKIVLQEIYGLSDKKIDDIKKALSILRNWRNMEKRRAR